MLRTAQALRLACRINRRYRAVGPCQPPQRGFETRAAAARRDRKQAAFAFDHHRAHFIVRCADQCDARIGIVIGNFAHPFGPGAGLAEAAPCHDQPCRPVAGRRQLLGMRPQPPVKAQFALAAFLKLAKAGMTFLGFERKQPFKALATA